MNKVLFLASWYPSRVNAFDGDFIERHAKSISLYNKVFVIYIVKDQNIRDGKIVIEKDVSGNLIAYKAYYPSYSKIGWIEKVHSNRWNFKLYQRIYQTIIHEYGQPDIVHLNVLMKAGLFAWWLKKKYNLPYVLSENWTGYYKESKQGYLQKSILYKFLSRMVFKNCSYALPVTNDLGERMNELFGKIPFKVIPNVVDTTLFYPVPENKNAKTRLIHISTLGYHKNIEGILHVTEKLYRGRKDFELYLIGPASNHILQWTEDRGLMNTCIFFSGLIPYRQVAEYLRNADALIMFSRYENLPCVILEALTCGLPVVSTMAY
jgi:glycosyltransferase involved in cell wall biosynthesis